MCRETRRGYEFSSDTKQAAKARSLGYCEYPDGCKNRHDGTVDHFTAIKLGRLLGLSREMITSVENAQMLCAKHNLLKTQAESGRILEVELTQEMERLKKPQVLHSRAKYERLTKEYGEISKKEVKIKETPFYKTPSWQPMYIMPQEKFQHPPGQYLRQMAVFGRR